MKIHLDVDVDEHVVDELGGPAAVQAEIVQLASLLFQSKRRFSDQDFDHPSGKPSFKEFLLSMPDGDLDYEMGVKAPE